MPALAALVPAPVPTPRPWGKHIKSERHNDVTLFVLQSFTLYFNEDVVVQTSLVMYMVLPYINLKYRRKVQMKASYFI